MINSLPLEVLRLVLFNLPTQDITSTLSVNKHINSEISREGFWKELCQHNYYSTKDFKKAEKESWKEHAQRLEKAFKWTDYHSALRVSNKGYTLTYVSPSSSSSSSSSSLSFPSLYLGVAEYPFVEGPFSGRYFEVTIDELPESKETPQIIVGIAPFNILDNPALHKVSGYINTGKSSLSSFGKDYGVGDTIGVLLNTEYMTLSFFKNNELQGTPYAYLDKTIPWHPVVGLFYQGCRVSIPLPPRSEPPHMPVR